MHCFILYLHAKLLCKLACIGVSIPILASQRRQKLDVEDSCRNLSAAGHSFSTSLRSDIVPYQSAG